MRTLWRLVSWPVLALGVASCGRIDYDLSAAGDGSVPPMIDARIPIDGAVIPPPDAAPDSGVVPDPTWWDPAWTHRVRLTVDTAGLTEDLFDVPIAVHLDDTRIDFAKVKSDGADLRFIASDNQTLLDYEIEPRFTDSTSEDAIGSGAVIWVKLPELKASAGGTDVWLYYGNEGSEPAQVPDKVWSAGYIGVWHLGQPEDPRDDATGHGNALAGSSLVPSAAGRLGDALAPSPDVDGLPLQRDVLESGGNDITGLTVEAWINAASSTDTMVIAAKSDGDFARTFEFIRLSDCTTELQLSFDCFSTVKVHSPATADVGVWHHVVATFDGDVMRMYQDGELTAEQIVVIEPPGDGGVGSSGFTPCDGGAPFTLGALAGGKLQFHGLVDELRLSGYALSPEWIRIQHRAMADGLLKYGAQEALP